MTDRQITDESWIPAQWPAPPGINAVTTARNGGTSHPPYDRFNLAMHVGDRPVHVDNNRQLLHSNLHLPSEPVWLTQTHGNQVINATTSPQDIHADGTYTKNEGIVCAVLTADCLPLLLCNNAGTQIAAIHIGWKGFCAGIIDNAIHSFPPGDVLMAWIGPCIRADNYEIGSDVYEACRHYSKGIEKAFVQNRPGHWLADLSMLVKLDLRRFGINRIDDCNYCTCTDAKRFFSYRRDGTTGRMASLIWMDAT